MDGQGNLERTWKVREESGNLKINSYGRQSSENLFCSRGERMHFLMRLSKPISLLSGGYSYRKKFAPLGSKFFPIRVTPKLEEIQLAPLNYRIKKKYIYIYFYLS